MKEIIKIAEKYGFKTEEVYDRKIDYIIKAAQYVFMNGDKKDKDYVFSLLYNKYYYFLIKQTTEIVRYTNKIDDYVQLALNYFYQAILKYNYEKGVFILFLKSFLRRQMIMAIKKNIRYMVKKETEITASELESQGDNLLLKYNLISSNNIKQDYLPLLDLLNNMLNDLEKNILYLYIKGYTYKEIANECNVPVRKIDISLNKIRKKIRKIDDIDCYF